MMVRGQIDRLALALQLLPKIDSIASKNADFPRTSNAVVVVVLEVYQVNLTAPTPTKEAIYGVKL
jgi:hypothetical protein